MQMPPVPYRERVTRVLIRLFFRHQRSAKLRGVQPQSSNRRRRVARLERQAQSVSHPATVPTMCLRENGPLGDGPKNAANIGRDGGIRTHDPLTPSQVRYQTALHPDTYFKTLDLRR